MTGPESQSSSARAARNSSSGLSGFFTRWLHLPPFREAFVGGGHVLVTEQRELRINFTYSCLSPLRDALAC
jgi:hypothetical protein